MKAPGLIAVILCILFIFSSCNTVRIIELSERLIVEAMGIDWENGEFQITLLALDTENVSSDNASGSIEKTKIYNFSADSIGRALALSKGLNGLTPLYSHTRILIMGRKAAEEKIKEIPDFFLREYTTRSDITLAVSQTTARAVLSANLGGSANGTAIEETVKAGKEEGKSTAVPLFKFVNLMLSETDTAYCPLIELKLTDDGKRQEIISEKTAFFDEDGLVFTADKELTRGLLLLKGEAKNQSISLESQKARLTLNTVKCKTKINHAVSNGKAYFQIKTDITADITEYLSEEMHGIGIEELEEIRKLLAERVKEYEERVLLRLFREKHLDVCRFSRTVLQKHPDFYESFRSDFSARTEYSLTVNATVRQSGRERLKDFT